MEEAVPREQVIARPRPQRPVTAQQRNVFDYVREYQARHRAPPTRREIAAHFGWKSATAAQQALRALERKGVLRLVTTSRGIEFELEPSALEGQPLEQLPLGAAKS